MSGSATCPQCQQVIQLKDADPEGRIKCRHCGTGFRIKRSAPAKPKEAAETATDVRTTVSTPVPAGAEPVEDPINDPVDVPVATEAEDDFGEATDTYRIAGDSADDPDPESALFSASSYEGGAADDDISFAGARPKKKKSGTKKAKAKAPPPNPVQELLQNRKVLVGLAATAGVLVVGLIAWSVMPNSQPAGGNAGGANVAAANAAVANPGANAAGGPAETKILNRPSRPVVLDKPPAAKPAALKAVEPLFKPALPFDEATALTRAAVEPPVEAAADAANAPAVVVDQAPRWQAEPDPKPAELRYSIAPGLKFELNGPGIHPGISTADNKDPQFPNLSQTIGMNLPPVFAEQDGPYMILSPVWKQTPYGRQWVVPKSKSKTAVGHFEIVEVEQDPIPVIDLRTGEAAGEFDWHIPFFLNPALSPDGKYLVGPYHVPLALDVYDKASEEELTKRQSMYVWERDSKKPPKVMKMPGLVACMRFAGPTTAVILVEQPQRQLEIWDVVEAKRTAVVELPLGPKTPSKDVFPYMLTDTNRTDLMINYPRAHHMLATSPGGRYAAVAGEKGVTFVSIPDAAILGTLELSDFSGEYEHYLGFEFLSTGDELCIAHRPAISANQEMTRILFCRVTDGTIRQQKDIGGMTRGPLWVHADRQSVLLADYPVGFSRSAPGSSSPLMFDLDKKLSEHYMYKWREPVNRAPVVLLMPDEGPVLILKVPGFAHTADLMVPTMFAIDQDVYREDVARKVRLNEHGLPKRAVVVEPDRSTLQPVTAAAPGKWTAMPAVAPAKVGDYTTIGRVPWPAAWGDQRAISLFEAAGWGEGFQTVGFQRIDVRAFDLKDNAEPAPPLTVLPWGVRPERFGYSVVREGLSLGMQRDASRIAVADPEYPGRVDVWTTAGARQHGFFVSDDRTQPIRWTDFDQADRLLTLSNGVLSSWEVTADGVKGVYSSDGGYTIPAVFAAGRSLLALSRGGSFDILETATGKVLNRCGTGTPGVVIDMAFSPDGKRLAAVFAGIKEPSTERLKHGEMPKSATGSQLVIWDLATGETMTADGAAGGTALVAWVDAEHVCVCSGTSVIYDLKLRDSFLSYTFYGRAEAPEFGMPLHVGPDGRIWTAVAAAAPGESPVEGVSTHSWKVTSLSTGIAEEIRPYFAADRTLFDSDTTPIQVKIDLGDEKQAKKQGESLVASLHGLGFKIGPGGSTLNVTAKVMGTGEHIQFKNASFEIPQVAYLLELFDREGRKIHSTHWQGSFPGERSKYKTTADLETRRANGGATFFDFQGRDPHEAMVEEILDTGRPLAVIDSFPKKLLFGDGKYVEAKKALHWNLKKE